MDAFEFATAGRVVFGAGRLGELPGIVGASGRRVLLVVGGSRERSSHVLRMLEDTGCAVTTVSAGGEPTVGQADQAAQTARETEAQLVVGFGGGSVIDLAKAIAALATNDGSVREYLEVIGDGRPLENDPLPSIAIPTTSGTGAEVTRNAVLHSPEHGVKVSLRHRKMLPAVALIDPETTISVPPEITATTGMDALTQLIEPLLSRRANPMTDGICREALPRVSGALERAVGNGKDLAARVEMAFGSFCSGLALANSGLGAVHGFAAPIGGMFNVPHGAVCAALLPGVMSVNLHRMRESGLPPGRLARFDEVARALTGDVHARAEDGIQWVSDLKNRLGVGDLRSLGVSPSAHALIAEKAAMASSMKGNPVDLSQDDLMEVLARA